MADTKLTGLSAITPVRTDVLYVADDPGGTPVSAKVTIEDILALAEDRLISTVNGEGASLIGIEDAAGLFTATNVEAALAEHAALFDDQGDIVTLNQVDVVLQGGQDVIIYDAGGSSSATRPTQLATKTVIWFNHGSSLPTNMGTFDIAIGDLLIEPMMIAVSDETTDLTTGTAKRTFRMPYGYTLTGVRASVNTAPTGSSLVVDINEGGTSVLSTKLSIDAGEKTSTTALAPAVISDSALADDAEITIDIDQIGSTVAGTGLKVTLLGTRV